MSDPTLTTIAGVALVPLIVGITELAKLLGLPARWSALLAVSLGLVASLGYQAAGSAPAGRAWADALVAGLALGLSAAGLYSAGRAQLRRE